MNRFQRLFKTVQRKLLDFLMTKYGLSIICLSIVVIIVCLIQLSDTILEYRIANLRNVINFKNASILITLNSAFKSDKSNNQPQVDDDLMSGLRNDDEEFSNLKSNIDAVYTWVNGSDPEHIKQLNKYKSINVTTKYKMEEFDQFYKRFMINNTSSTQDNLPCFHKFCIQTNNLIIIQPELTQTDKNNLLKNAIISTLPDINIIDSNKNVSLIQLKLDLKTNSSILLKLINLFSKSFPNNKYKLFMGYYTIDDCSLIQNCLKHIDRTFIAKKTTIPAIKETNDNLKERLKTFYKNNNFLNLKTSIDYNNDDIIELPKYLNNDNLVYKFDYTHVPFSSASFDGSDHESGDKNKSSVKKKDEKSTAQNTYLSVFKVKSREIDSNLNENYILPKKLLISNETQSNKTICLELYRANIVWDLGDPFIDDIAENRFFDNDELKYSLRSIEKYAPWFRYIYIVTNGQIPSWLNLSNPKIRLVNHKDIFPNQTHLPTFSSPAIESHLHRINGLSKRFVYFNDDILLGKRIWPEDFITRSNGFKFYLAWQLPGCNQNCPSTWIRDGYCDKACNTTECDFDGGDCNKNSTNSRYGAGYDQARLSLFANQSQQLFSDLYCSPGCSSSWLADSYCDNACNVLKCAYDMGDCGESKYKEDILAFNLFEGNQIKFPFEKIIELPTDTQSFYVNFTLPNQSVSMVGAHYEDNKNIRKMSIVNKWHLLTVLLMKQDNSTVQSQDVIKISLQSNINKIPDELKNITLLVKLNALKTNHKTVSISSSTLSPSTTTTKKILTYKPISLSDLGPKLIKDLPIRSKSLNDLLPDNVKFSNQLFKSIYVNYYDYLNWSLANEYLTQDGLKYKLNILYDKLNDKKLLSSYFELKDSISQDYEDDLVFKFLFSNETISVLNDLDKQVLMLKYLNQTENQSTDLFMRFKKRKLLDTFADSLRYVNKLFNKLYGFTARKVPAHMPHMIDTNIMNSLQIKFNDEFEKTSSNRFRTPNDMQYSFSYYYYVMSELEDYNASRLFDEFDLNKNGYLDQNELLVINIKMSPKPFTFADYLPLSNSPQQNLNDMFELNKDFVEYLNECNNNQTNNRIGKVQFLNCTSLNEYLKEKFWSLNLNTNDQNEKKNIRYKYKFETLGDEEAKFIMIGGQPMDIEIKLNNLIRQPPKFMCLNDNIDYKLKHESTELKKILLNFYSTLFPLKSSFEKNEINLDLHKYYLKMKKEKVINDEEIERKYDRYENAKSILIVVVLLISFVLVLYFVFACLYRYVCIYIFKRDLSTNRYQRATKMKIKTKDYKISESMRRKQMEEHSSSSDSSTHKSSLFSSENETEDKINSQKSSSSVGIFMRSKRNFFLRKQSKTNKSSKISNI